jgi:hypothetical protein
MPVFRVSVCPPCISKIPRGHLGSPFRSCPSLAATFCAEGALRSVSRQNQTHIRAISTRAPHCPAVMRIHHPSPTMHPPRRYLGVRNEHTGDLNDRPRSIRSELPESDGARLPKLAECPLPAGCKADASDEIGGTGWHSPARPRTEPRLLGGTGRRQSPYRSRLKTFLPTNTRILPDRLFWGRRTLT